MPRQSPVLSWTLLRQSCSGLKCTQPLHQKRWRDVFGAAKELPPWAAAFSSRRLHASANVRKPSDDSTLHSVGINWENVTGGEASSDSYMQVLLEWKALQNKIKDKTVKIHLPAIEWSPPPPAPQTRVLPEFFIPNTPKSTAPVTSKEEMQEHIIAKTRQNIPNIALQNRLWITDADPEALQRASTSAMSQIRDGERDVNRLARVFLHNLKTSGSDILAETTGKEQARLFVFSDWIAKATHALMSKHLRVRSVALCINVTADLYQSMQGKDSKETTGNSYGLEGIRRATLHRLFGLLYPYTRLQGTSQDVANASCQALVLISRLLRDEGMRPSQARYLCRRHLDRMERMAMAKAGTCNQAELWSEAVMTVKSLMDRGILLSPSSTIEEQSSTPADPMDTFLRLLCLALVKGHLDYEWAETAILDLARAIQVRMFELKTLKKDGEILGGPIVDAFVSQSTLEEMVSILIRSGRHDLAREIAFMAPKHQRSVRVLSLLMHRWSSVLPDLTDEDAIKREQAARARRVSFRTCSISERLWLEARSLLNVKDNASLPSFYEIFSARMAFHARSKAPRLVYADLEALQKLHGGAMPLLEVPGLLHRQAQVEIVRAHTRAVSLAQARQWAHRIISAVKTRQTVGNEGDVVWLPLQILNVLLSAYLRLKGNGKVLTARRRFSMILRHGGAIKRERSYLRATVNRYFQSKRKQLLPPSRSTNGLTLFRFTQATDFFRSFSTRHGILPDEKTARILLAGVVRMSSRKVSVDTLLRIKEQADFDWKIKGVTGVLDELKTLLAGGSILPSTRDSSSKEGSKRAQMIDAAIEKREWRQYFGRQEGRHSRPSRSGTP